MVHQHCLGGWKLCGQWSLLPPFRWVLMFAAMLTVLLAFKLEISAAVLRGAEFYWSTVGLHQLAGRVDRAFLGDQRVMEAFLAKAEGTPGPKPAAKRGILVPAGGLDQLANAFVNINVLRHHLGCTLPITIAFWGAIEREKIDAATVEFFSSQLKDVSFLDLAGAPYPAHQRWLFPPVSETSYVGFKVKVFALYAAPYTEVLVIDSDSMPLMDPTLLFDEPAYAKHGAMFWPDRWCVPVRLFGKLGMEDGGGGRRQTDSGQFLFHRERHARVLDWLLFLNTHNEFTYRYAHGDKDTFRAAFEMAGKRAEYHQVDQPLSVALAPGLWGAKSRGFVQHLPNGSLAFVHRTSEAKYRARSSAGRGFSRLLLQPSCQWSQKHWHFFSPALGVRPTRVLKTHKCNYTLWDPQAAARHCHAKAQQQQQQKAAAADGNSGSPNPPLLEVRRTSYVGRAQEAADAAVLAFEVHVQSRPDLYPPPPGAGTLHFLIVVLIVGVGAWCVTQVASAMWRGRQWSQIPSFSSPMGP